jgi:type IV pilus assembly protein PilA
MMMMKKQKAFTLIEVVVVIALIAILALMALPDFSLAAVRKQIKESEPLIKVAKGAVGGFYGLSGTMPKDNAEAGLPEPAKLVGNHVAGIEVKDGAVHITFGNMVHGGIKDKKLTLRPAYVEGQQAVPVAWVCSKGEVPKGMVIAGVDLTDFPDKFLPIECRSREVK